jgi:hypothetical protein
LPCRDHKLARADKPVVGLKLPERAGDLVPSGVSPGLVEACEHLMQRAKGFLLEP